MGANCVRGRLAAFRQQRIGNAVREMAVRLMLNSHKLEWQVGGKRIDHQAGPAIPRVYDNLQRAESTEVDVTKQVTDIGRLVEHLVDGRRCSGGNLSIACSEVANIKKPRVAADWSGALAH